MSCKQWVCLLVLILPGWAQAGQPHLQTEQVNLDTANLLGLGGSSDQKLAQVFEVHGKGWLSHITLPMNCQPTGKVTVRIEKVDATGAPSGSVLAEEIVPGTVFTSYPTPAIGFRLVQFTKPVHVYPGHYALTLETSGGDCGIYAGPRMDSYPAAAAFFDARPNPPGWIELFVSPGVYFDLAFQVYLRN